MNLAIDGKRMLDRLSKLGDLGRDADGQLTRLAGTDADKLGRDCLVQWCRAAGLDVQIDRVGNIIAIWQTDENSGMAPIMLGSHIDTVIGAGKLDGCYGVIAGLEVIETLKQAGVSTGRPLAVCAFTNEEGVRFAPDMMGSLVYAGGLAVDDALDSVGIDGPTLMSELERIGYLGAREPGFLRPFAYLELHIEQGPILEAEGIAIGAVSDVQGICWKRLTICGQANHAGTTPMSLRRDPGIGAARIISYLHERASAIDSGFVVTVGSVRFEPDAINVIPSSAVLTVDLRSPDEDVLKREDGALEIFAREMAAESHLGVELLTLVRTTPVAFDEGLVDLVERTAKARGLSCRRIVSGAGHDAQTMAVIAPSAMIFVPSIGGISHNALEFTPDDSLVAGANVLLDSVLNLDHSACRDQPG